MKSIASHLKFYSLPILAGLFIGTSYIPLYPWAMFFAYTPLFIFWSKEKSLRKILIGGWYTQFILNIIGFHWIAHTVQQFGGMPLLPSILVLLIFCSVAHLYFPIVGALWFFIRKYTAVNNKASLLSLPLLFILVEHYYPSMFTWHMGYAWLWAGLPGYQTAELWGFVGLYFFTLCFSVSLAFFYLQKNKKITSAYIYGPLLFFLLINVQGYFIEQNLPKEDSNLNVLIVQANIGNAMKASAGRGGAHETITYITNKFFQLTESGLQKYPKTELVVWPETAFQSTYRAEQPPGFFVRKLIKFAQKNAVSVFTGIYERKELSNRKIYNSVIQIDAQGKVVDTYQKNILLAFGEYIPGEETFPALRKWLPMVSNFGRGDGQKAFPWPKAKLGPQICYEGLFDDLSGRIKKSGAQLIVNVTNDSWYDLHFEPNQHMYMTLARAVEFRLPLIRSTNTGISTVVTASGKILPLSPQQQEWVGSYNVPFYSTPPDTIFSSLVMWKEWIILALLTIVIGGTLVISRRTGLDPSS